jgi:hypothetical protein
MTVKKNTLATIAGILALASLAPIAQAGDAPVRFLMSGGLAPTVGETSNYLTNGWTLDMGLQLQPDTAGQLALQLDLSYSSFNAKNSLLQLGQAQSAYISTGNGTVWSLSGDAKWFTDTDRIRGYGLLGGGLYHRYVGLSEAAYGTGIICDPWWGWCYPVAVSGTTVVASRANYKFGMNAGIGVEYVLENDSAWFIEARYTWVNGTHPTEFVPIVIGFKF